MRGFFLAPGIWRRVVTGRVDFPALAVGLDLPDLDTAMALGRAVAPYADIVKVGLELLAADTRGTIEAAAQLGPAVFCDVKLCDIPRTVAAAARALARLPVDFITVHTDGGPDMLRAAVAGAAEGAADAGRSEAPRVLGVTVLTSLDRQSLAATGLDAEPADVVRVRANLAAACGLDGIVCAAPDLAAVGEEAPGLLRVTPGIRPAGHEAGSDDQARVATPGSALAAGADVLVVARPIVAAADPAGAAKAFAEEAVAYRDLQL